MNKQTINQILKQNQENYNEIANNFDKTRSFLWPEIEATARYISPESHVLDAGCGNGRLFPFIQKLSAKYLGFDNSEELIKICQQKYGTKYFFVGDVLNSQFDNSIICNYKFDVIYCLAVLHHIPSEELRLKALGNLKSLLKPGSILIISVWNLWQRKYLKYLIKVAFLKLIRKSQLDWQDCYIPYKIKNCRIKNSLEIGNCPPEADRPLAEKLKIVNRYLHAFTLKELSCLIKKAGFKIIESRKIKGNLVIVARIKC